MKAKLTISRPSYGNDKEKILITVRDDKSRTRFLEIEMDYSTFAEVLTGASESECDMQVKDLDKVGKSRETGSIEFKMPNTLTDRKQLAGEIAKINCPEGWTPDLYFGSQSSFFYKDKETWARTRILRWV